MRLRTVLAVMLILALLPCLARAQQGASPQIRLAWEYKELSRPDIEKLAGKDDKDRFVTGLNKLGAEGWEIVALEPPGHGEVYLFKRPAGARKAEPKAEAKPMPAGKPVPAHIVRLKFAKAPELAKTLMAVFKKAEGLNIVADERTNALILLGSEEQVFEVARVLQELDQEGPETPKGKLDKPKDPNMKDPFKDPFKNPATP